jgi:hypothetical protein
MGHQLVAALPDCRAHFLDAGKHFSWPVRHLETIAAALVRQRGRDRAQHPPAQPHG